MARPRSIPRKFRPQAIYGWVPSRTKKRLEEMAQAHENPLDPKLRNSIGAELAALVDEAYDEFKDHKVGG